MKSVVIAFALAFCISSFGQSPDTIKLPTREYYQQRSDSQQHLAKVFLIGGSAMMFLGVVGFNSTSDYGAADAYGYMFVGGSVAALASLPLFISASRNARRAEASLSLQHQQLLLPPPGSGSCGGYPSLAITLTFN